MNSITNIFKKTTSLDERCEESFIEGGRRDGENENPYLSARRTWDSHTGSIISSRRNWQAVGIIASMILLVSVGGNIHLASQSKFIPYVIEVDKLGVAQSYGPIDSTIKSDPRILKSTVAEFISDARLVTPDITLQRAAIFRIYSRITSADPSTQKMNEWMNGDSGSNPFERAKKVMINIEIKSVMPQTSDTWQIDWIETVRDRNGGIIDKPINYRALVTVYVAAPSPNTTEKALRMNPLGIYIKNYSWQKLL